MAENSTKFELVYFIYGKYDLLLKEALNRLTAKISTADRETLQVSRFSVLENDIDEIMISLETLSFLSGQRLIVVEDILEIKKAAQKRLLDYIGNPNPQTVLVITTSLDGKDGPKKLKQNQIYKACSTSKVAQVHEYKLKGGTSSWTKQRFAARGKTIDDKVLDFLLARVGDNLNRLENEITKISDAAGKDVKEIDKAIVEHVAAGAFEAEVFDLISTVIDRDAEMALTQLSTILMRDSALGRIFSLLERQFRLLLLTKTKGKGMRGQNLAKALGVSPGQTYYLEKQSRLFTLPQLKGALMSLVEIDHARKNSATPPKLLLEKTIVDLCGI